MANRTVKLYRNCKTPDGWRRFPAVMAANGKVKPNAVAVGGVEVVYLVGHYELRSYDGSRTVWTRVEGNATDALAEQKTAQKKAAAKAMAGTAGVQVIEDTSRRVLREQVKKWLASVQDKGSLEALELYRRTMDGFLLVCKKIYVDELTHDDILSWRRSQRGQGYADRTIANRHTHLKTFLLFLNFDRETIKRIAGPKPKYEKTLPEIYEPADLKVFFDALSNVYDFLLFNVLLKTGLREREAAHLEWSDIHWSRAVLKVRSKPKWGHKIKDAEEREMAIPADLLERLKFHHEANPKHTLIFGKNGGTVDQPDGHLLRRLKSLVRQAGLNCGHCSTCKQRNECEKWFLHKFRATYITKLLRSGIDLRTVMTLSGHADIESVMRYLRPAEGKAVQDKVNSIDWLED